MSEHFDSNGKRLEVKEGVVLDQEGHKLYTPERPTDQQGPFGQEQPFGPKFYVFRPNRFIAPLLILAVPVFLVAGLAVASVIAGTLLLLWALGRIFRLITTGR